MPNEPEVLVLVDGSSYLYRAFHAMPMLTSSKGEPTGAAYGIANMLRRLRAELPSVYFVVVFDAPGPTFRDEIYPEYKANRPPMPDELRAQIEPIHALVEALGLPLLEVSGVEADDVIGTLARRAMDAGIEVMMSTGDKDMAQLVTPSITLANTMDGTALDPAGVEEKFGVPPERIVDYLALVGDKVDNVPGVPKVGPKTAVKWLSTYGSLDGVVEHADEIGGKVGEYLRASLEQLSLSRELVTIRVDVDLDLELEELRPRPPDVQRLRDLYARLEFKTWLAELLADGAAAAAGEPADAGDAPVASYETVLDVPALDRWIRRLESADLFAFDTETTSLDYMRAEVVGVSFCVEPGEAAYVPLAHTYEGAPEQLGREVVLERLRPLLEDEGRDKVGQNLKYDMSVLARHGIALAGVRFDTMLESYVIDATGSRHDMDSLALKHLGHRTTHFDEVAGKGAAQLTFDQVEIEPASHYAAEDADVTMRLHRTLWPKLAQAARLRQLFEQIEMPLVPVLSRIERTGVRVDAGMLAEQSQDLARRMDAIIEAAHAAAGETFNLASPKQIQHILFEKHDLPVRAKTPKGQPSTAEYVLEELANEHELPRLILQHRALAKLKSTYTDALPARIDPLTGRVHTSYHQAVAATGRLSSSEPNLQNIPVRTEEGRRIRKAFVAEPGNLLLAADYSQIELRIMAHLSGDEGLLAAFAAGEDIHRATAAEVFGTAPGVVTAEQRRRAKAINFGLIYGMSAFGLARQLNIPRAEAQEYIDLYFGRYPGVKVFMDRIREQARDSGYVETVFGRRLYLPEIASRNVQRRQYAERTAINAPMQGTAADIIKQAMLRLDAWLRDSGADARMIMQVHDELVLEVAVEAVDTVREAVVKLMTGAADLSVPLLVESGIGRDWDEAH
jgi:DNA polymerase-1